MYLHIYRTKKELSYNYKQKQHIQSSSLLQTNKNTPQKVERINKYV